MVVTGYVFKISVEFEATHLGTVAPTPFCAISLNFQETSKKLVAPTTAGSTYLEVRTNIIFVKMFLMAFSLLCWIFQSLSGQLWTTIPNIEAIFLVPRKT